MNRARRAALATLLVAVLATAGCVSLPVEGPVVSRDADPTGDVRQAIDIDARPPEAGASRLQVVTGFLDAMTAWPIQTPVAKEYLSEDAAGEWNPEASTVVYADALPPRESAGTVNVELTGADRLDAVGSWRGSVPESELTLEFSMTIEEGEFRITDPPDALVVPASWFQQRYQQVALYYFDPTATILVPEPVFLPEGAQRATTLVSALLAGPPEGLTDVVRSYLPANVGFGLSVPVSETGVADVELVGEAPQPSDEEAELLIAQLAWTLRQDPEIAAFRVRVDGEEIRLADGDDVFPVTSGNQYDPHGIATSDRLYAIRNGRLLQGDEALLEPVSGPFGSARYQLESVAVHPDGSRAAGITDSGSVALVGPVGDPAGGDSSDDGEDAVETVLSGAVDLARPTWDFAGRLWLLDRRPGGAVVWVADAGQDPRLIAVEGITGTSARRLLVSRDGTRLVAAVRRSGGDAVVGIRVVTGARGRVARTAGPFLVDAGRTGQRIVDLAWASRTRLAVLTPARPGSLFEADIVPVDGASVGVDTVSTIISGRVLGLAGPGTETSPTYAVLRDGLVDVRTRELIELPQRVDQLANVG